MRAFTAAELTRLRAVDTSTLGDESGLGFTAVISRVTVGDDPLARTVVVPTLACGRLIDLDQREKELVPGMAAVSRAFKVKTEVNTAVTRGLRFISGCDYFIRYVSQHPASDPQFYYLFLEDDGVNE